MQTAHLPSFNDEPEGQSLQLLTFTIGDELYGIDIMQVREVKGWSQTTRLPNSAEYLRGVLNLRGAIVPIYDLRMRLHRQMTAPDDTHVIIICAMPSRVVGILVDAVSDILTVHEDALKAPPCLDETGGDAPSNLFVQSLIAQKDRMVVVLDLSALLEANALEAQSESVPNLTADDETK